MPINAVQNSDNFIAQLPDTLKDEGPQLIMAIDEYPQVVHRVDPKYPKSALKDSIEGKVYVTVLVTDQGEVKDIKVAKGIRKDFNNAAIEALKGWKFTPAKSNGKFISYRIVIPFEFKIYGDRKKQKKEDISPYEASASILEVIRQILRGDDYNEKLKPFINPEADLIYKEQWINLHAVLNGEHKEIMLLEGHESDLIMVKMWVSMDNLTGYAILKTQIKKSGLTRLHTIIFAKTENSDWQIKHWHVSW
jgi:TonB family protein